MHGSAETVSPRSCGVFLSSRVSSQEQLLGQMSAVHHPYPRWYANCCPLANEQCWECSSNVHAAVLHLHELLQGTPAEVPHSYSATQHQVQGFVILIDSRLLCPDRCIGTQAAIREIPRHAAWRTASGRIIGAVQLSCWCWRISIAVDNYQNAVELSIYHTNVVYAHMRNMSFLKERFYSPFPIFCDKCGKRTQNVLGPKKM